MKQAIPILTFLAIAFVLTSTTCKKDATSTSYNCQCTYIAVSGGPSAGQANKVENTTVQGTTSGEANVNCQGLVGKYDGQFFTGTCVLQ